MMNKRVYFIVGLIILLSTLIIPSQLEPDFAQAQTAPEGQVYTVQRSDSLWRLAEKYLGDGNLFPLIVEATAEAATSNPQITVISEPSLLLPGQQIWIPAEVTIANVPSEENDVVEPKVEIEPEITEAAETTSSDIPQVGEPYGHIAFSFWNNSPDRCTYEVNVIDVGACLEGSEQCQANRRIVGLNNISEPALSPEGDRLAFRGWGEPPTEDNPYFGCADPHFARHLGHTTLDATGFTGTGGFWEDSHPDWSPDGNRLVFDSGRNGDGITRLYTIYADGSSEEDLRIIGQQPSWAPDNERFVYRGCDLSGNGCGLRLGVAVPTQHWDTGENMLGSVVEDGQAAHPDWSPINDEIIYQSAINGGWDLYIVEADGSNLRQLTTDGIVKGLPVWSPDGEWIAYTTFDGVNWSLRIIRRDGTNDQGLFVYDGGIYAIPKVVEPYGVRDWLDEQISWSK